MHPGIIRAASGRVFVKAGRDPGRLTSSLEREAAINPAVAHISPPPPPKHLGMPAREPITLSNQLPHLRKYPHPPSTQSVCPVMVALALCLFRCGLQARSAADSFFECRGYEVVLAPVFEQDV
jgi:hypothetical protein